MSLGNIVKRQALVMGFSDAFAVVGIVLVLSGIAICSRENQKAQRLRVLGTSGSVHRKPGRRTVLGVRASTAGVESGAHDHRF